jgi:hypothetical protein
LYVVCASGPIFVPKKSAYFDLQLVIDAAFGWLFFKKVTAGHGDSVSSFLASNGKNWDVCNANSGVQFPKERVFTEWLWGWMSANDLSADLRKQCPACGGSCKAIGIDACYVAVSRSTLSGKNLFSVCIV